MQVISVRISRSTFVFITNNETKVERLVNLQLYSYKMIWW